MRTAIVGLPMVGKTSLFTILTGVHESARVGSMETRLGVVKVPDERVPQLVELFQPKKVVYATMEYLDFPAISKEALRDASYIGSLRQVDALAHVLRVFEDDTVPHEKVSVDPARDLDDIETELILSDLVVLEKRLEKLAKDRLKIKNADLDREYEVLNKLKPVLDEGVPLRGLELSADEDKRIRGFGFLSRKPILYVLNLGEDDASNLHKLEQEFRDKYLKDRPLTDVTAICGRLEAELAELPPEEASEYMASYNLPELALDRIILAGYSLLGMMSFLTVGEDEVRAWTIPMGTTALKAAGAIHSDFEKKFIRAEVVNWKILVDNGGYAGAREKGLLRLESKDHIIEDGDILVIRHG